MNVKLPAKIAEWYERNNLKPSIVLRVYSNNTKVSEYGIHY